MCRRLSFDKTVSRVRLSVAAPFCIAHVDSVGYALAAPPGATVMDDVWISGHLARRHIKRYVVPFDADQYTSDPRLENVVTLDSNLGQGVSNRAAANEIALDYFRGAWDVVWDPPLQEPKSS